MYTNLQQQFFELYTFLNIAKKYLDTIAAFENDTKACETKYLKLKNSKSSALIPNVLCIFGGITLLLAGFGVCLTSLVNADPTFSTVDLHISNYAIFIIGIILILISLVLILPIPIILVGVCKSKTKKLQKQADKFWKNIGSPTVQSNTTAITQLRNEYEQFCDKYVYTFDFLPSQYHQMDTICHMYSIVTSGRADSLKEVINIYEEEMRWMQLQNQLAYQQQIMNQNMQNLYDQQVKTNRILNEIEFFQICHYMENN